MGFEINFNAYDKNQDGKGYDMEHPKPFKKQIGKMDDVPLEKVAAEIVKQMARRDVLVEVQEVFEYTKKSVSFRETKGALVIKNQKFTLDGLPIETSPEPVGVAPEVSRGSFTVPSGDTLPFNGSPPRSLRERLGVETTEVQSDVVFPSANTDLRVLRMECFDPDDATAVIGRLGDKGMSFTVGKKYPVFKESSKEVTTRSDRGVETNVLLIYKVSDDNGKIVDLPSTYFRLPTPGLTFMGNQPARPKQEQPRLLYMGNGSSYGSGGRVDISNDSGKVMPSLRRGV